jgi:hypothetical protein
MVADDYACDHADTAAEHAGDGHQRRNLAGS